MEILYNLAEEAANLFDAMSLIIFLLFLLKRNERIQNHFLFGLVTTAFILVLAYFQDRTSNTMIQLVVIITIGLVFECLFFEDKFGVKLIYNMLFNVVLMLTNMVTVYGIVILTELDVAILCSKGSMTRIMILIIHKIMLFSALASFWIIGKLNIIKYKEWIAISIMFIGTLSVAAVMVNIVKTGHLTEQEEVQMVFIVLGLAAISLYIFIYMYQLKQKQWYDIENEKLKTKLAEERHMIEKMEEMYEDNRILRHDLKRYLTVVLGMLNEEDVEQAKSYIHEVTGNKFDQGIVYYTKNSVLNAVLSQKADICAKQNISFEVKISGEISKEKQTDVGIMLSNLIDNAIEAELKEEKRMIEVQLLRYKGMYMIIVKNYIHESVLTKNPELKTGKADKKHHGIGIKSVKKIVRNLDGMYMCQEEENKFITKISLPDSAEYAKNV